MKDHGWKALGPAEGERVSVVYPLNDLHPHDIDFEGCPCLPKFTDDGLVLVHNSFDGREKRVN